MDEQKRRAFTLLRSEKEEREGGRKENSYEKRKIGKWGKRDTRYSDKRRAGRGEEEKELMTDGEEKRERERGSNECLTLTPLNEHTMQASVNCCLFLHFFFFIPFPFCSFHPRLYFPFLVPFSILSCLFFS